jgi:hypothetical protein
MLSAKPMADAAHHLAARYIDSSSAGIANNRRMGHTAANDKKSWERNDA